MNGRVRPQFYLDVAEEIQWLIENAGSEVAKAWHDAAWDTILFLERNPRLGRQRKDLKEPGIRSWRVNHFTRWLIFYRVENNRIVVYCVRSGTMNLIVPKMKS